QDHVLQVGRERPDGAVDRHQAVLADVVVLGERRGPVLDRGEARVHLLEELLQVLRARVLRPLDARPMVLVMLDADALVLRRPELGPRLPEPQLERTLERLTHRRAAGEVLQVRLGVAQLAHAAVEAAARQRPSTSRTASCCGWTKMRLPVAASRSNTARAFAFAAAV